MSSILHAISRASKNGRRFDYHGLLHSRAGHSAAPDPTLSLAYDTTRKALLPELSDKLFLRADPRRGVVMVNGHPAASVDSLICRHGLAPRRR